MNDRFDTWKKPEVEHNKLTSYNWVVTRPEHFCLGEHTDIGAFCYFASQQGIRIGDNTQIGATTCVYSVDTEDNVVGEVIIGKDVKIGAGCKIYPNVVIGDNVKIDANCVIKYGVKIGDGAKVGVLSYVKKDIPKGEFWYGIPASFRKVL